MNRPKLGKKHYYSTIKYGSLIGYNFQKKKTNSNRFQRCTVMPRKACTIQPPAASEQSCRCRSPRRPTSCPASGRTRTSSASGPWPPWPPRFFWGCLTPNTWPSAGRGGRRRWEGCERRRFCVTEIVGRLRTRTFWRTYLVGSTKRKLTSSN